ncbi:MAG: aminotransferase class I/II-fold pyridoxal phosphate-dependent enzyme [Clostridiales Family XIII bacterium]|jgi:arginine/lysine/ornithine decarboxylase|nr:aminotransferase class I/II-fold pyridoxal phosphate-dependent enzyme [Clostridiales Family XIII bacterium]
MNQFKTPLYDAVTDYIGKERAPLFIPAHKLGRAIHPKWKAFAGDAIFKMDLCELEGLDDLHNAGDVIAEAQKLAADAWGADESFFLINGTSSGIVAAICSAAAPGEKIIVPRNAHKSVVSGLIISGAEPVYAMPDIWQEKGLIGGMPVAELARLLAENPDAKAVFAVSPSYHGVCSDIKSLADKAHERGCVFIADEAHGNHVYFHESLPDGALTLGADISCQSTHKMSGSLTQSSILHVRGNRIDTGRLRANLRLMQSTSPSYLLMSSLDLARSHIATAGHDIFAKLLPLIEDAKERLRATPGIDVLGEELVGNHAIYAYEPTRIILSARRFGIEGYELYETLRRDYGVEAEFGDYFYVICVLGLGTTEQDLIRLTDAVSDIASKRSASASVANAEPLIWKEALPPLPPMAVTPREAHFAETARIPWNEAKGKISAELIAPYPPGIPALCPGEYITDEMWEYLDTLRRAKRHMQGPGDSELATVAVLG